MNVGGTGGAIGGTFFTIMWILVAVFVVYNMIFDPAALKRIPQDIASYINSITHHTPAHSTKH